MNGVTLDTMIRAMLLKQPYNQPRLGREAKRFARRLSNRFGRDLPEDLHEDVAQQALLQIWGDGPDGLKSHSGLRLFSMAVMKAIRTVRASYVQPGVPTRRPAAGKPNQPRRVAAEDIGRIADARTLERCTVESKDGRSLDLDLVASPQAGREVQNLFDRIDADRVLRKARPDVARALRLIYFDGEAKVDVARTMGLTRFALERRFRALSEGWGIAA